MNLPIEWLKKYVDLNKISIDDIENTYTMLGFMKDAPTINDVFSLEVRQNRPDCLSILGLAREISAVNGLNLNTPKIPNIFSDLPKNNLLDINTNLVKRFSAVLIENVEIKKSPDWMINLLSLYGIPSINNIVDITNYVMVEQGQPMHPFDFNKISGEKLIVRLAKDNEQIVTLEGLKFKLTNQDLVIADNQSVSALAGIVGSRTSQIDLQTRTILLEAAIYDNANIRKTSRRHSVRTEASLRLEKFLSLSQTEIAINRAVSLIQEIIPSVKISYMDDYYPSIHKDLIIKFDYDEVKRITGIQIENNEIEKALTSFGFEILENKLIKVPYYRTDIEIEDDLVEEVLRYFGYQNIPTIAINSAPPKNIKYKEMELSNFVKDYLVRIGFHEHISSTLIKSDDHKKRVLLENPLNKDNNSLRISILETLQNYATTYKKHKISDYKIFEVGKVFKQENNKYSENLTLGCIFSVNYSFRQVKGYLEEIIKSLNVSNNDIIYLNENSFEILLDNSSPKSVQNLQWELLHEYSEEISVLIPSNIPVGDIIIEMQNQHPKITTLELIDIYKGKSIDQSSRSILIRACIKSKDNIDPQNANLTIDELRNNLRKRGFEIRD